MDPARPCDRRAELAGLGAVLVTREAAIARLAVRLGGHGVDPHSAAVRRHFVLPAAAFAWARAADHCRFAWLRGWFLARGSLSLAAGRAHLEFVVTPEEAPELAGRLAAMDLPCRRSGRRRRRHLEEHLSRSPRSSAGSAPAPRLLELEARSVARTLRGELNRVLNAESANLQRSVAASGRQLAGHRRARGGRASRRSSPGPSGGRRGAARDPEASLSEIAVRLDLHRSAVQRALDRMERLALHDDEGVGLRSRHRPYGAAGGEPTGRRGTGRAAAHGGPVGREVERVRLA